MNEIYMGGLAWTGYLAKSRRAVMVYASQEDEDPLEENLQGKIDYLSTKEGVQSYLEGTQLHQFVNIRLYWVKSGYLPSRRASALPVQ